MAAAKTGIRFVAAYLQLSVTQQKHSGIPQRSGKVICIREGIELHTVAALKVVCLDHRNLSLGKARLPRATTPKSVPGLAALAVDRVERLDVVGPGRLLRDVHVLELLLRLPDAEPQSLRWSLLLRLKPSDGRIHSALCHSGVPPLFRWCVRHARATSRRPSHTFRTSHD